MSTNDFQDVATSLGWQRDMAVATIAGRGVIVAEYFDADCSREVAWRDRPAASALLAAVRHPDRRFDAVVVGEYERAFCGDQFSSVMAELARVGVEVWLPEAGGLVRTGDPVHRTLLLLLGHKHVVRLSGQGIACWQRCPHKCTRADIQVVARHTDTAW